MKGIKKYEIISFEHIFKNEFSRVFFCDYLMINFNKESKKQKLVKTFINMLLVVRYFISNFMKKF